MDENKAGMIKEYGSIFPIFHDEINTNYGTIDKKGYCALCREALLWIARQNYHKKRVLIPAYTCNTVYLPFLQEKWDLLFYSINKDLTINTQSLLNMVKEYNPSVLILHPYFGCDLSHEEIDTLSTIKTENNISIVVDYTQCAFSSVRYKFADFNIASLRKWGPIPDGAFFEKYCELGDEYTDFIGLQYRAMVLRGNYFETGDLETKTESITINKRAEKLINQDIEFHSMSNYSLSRYCQWDISGISSSRIKNYKYLHSLVINVNGICSVINDIERLTTAPLYFPIYCEDRTAVQKRLAENKIYAPIIWPIEDSFVLIDNDVKFIYDHILCIPIDQRYGLEDMQYILDTLNK